MPWDDVVSSLLVCCWLGAAAAPAAAALRCFAAAGWLLPFCWRWLATTGLGKHGFGLDGLFGKRGVPCGNERTLP